MMIRRQLTPKEALVKAETLCARSERCRSEVSEKLRQWGVGSNDVSDILDSLEKRRFIDDRRYAEAFVRSKFLFSRWGRVKIVQALSAKRVSRELVDEAIELIDEEEYINAAAYVVKRKASGMDVPLSREDASRVARFAMNRGFEWKYVKSAMDLIGKADEEDF